MYFEPIDIRAMERLAPSVAALLCFHVVVYLFSDWVKFIGFRVLPASSSELKGLVLRALQTIFVGSALLCYSGITEMLMWIGLGGMLFASAAWWQSNPGLAKFSCVLLALALLCVLTFPAITY